MTREIKTFLVKVLPPSLVHYIKKVRYTRAIRKASEDTEIDMKMLRHLIRRGDAVIDIGASIGYYSKIMGELVGPEGSVYSIEPIPYTFGILSYMVRKLHLENTTTINCAISDHNEMVSMAVPVNKSGEPNLYESRVVTGELNLQSDILRVEARTVDSLFASNERAFSFIKCDAEGHELKCLIGAREMMRKWKPAWMVEIWDVPGDRTKPGFKTLEFMREEGYQVFWFDGHTLRRLKADSRSVNGNYFFLLPHHLTRLCEIGLVEKEEV